MSSTVFVPFPRGGATVLDQGDYVSTNFFGWFNF